MQQVLQSIIAFFSSIVSFFENLLHGTAQLLKLIPAAFSMLSYCINQLPPVLVVFAIAFVTVSVVYLVVGR